MKDSPGHGQRVPRELRRKLGGDALDKFVYMFVVDRLSGDPPALIIDAANDNGELSAEMDRLFGSQAVPQGMQHGAQGAVGVMAPFEVMLRRDPFQPQVRLLVGMLKRWNLSVAHVCLR
ncbi:hypothetical protein MPC4_450008 [Methylocella tundrae]|uniref:Uncharacterized protein n=1 Tax=Methylocella tundrae TaxID=227605 RepID=A0A8B6M9I7_METTU|nr:hypothetical protein MPC4_450008 [Methylocella tundrae]